MHFSAILEIQHYFHFYLNFQYFCKINVNALKYKVQGNQFQCGLILSPKPL